MPRPWLRSARETALAEWSLVRRFPRLAAALVGLLFVPSLYALIYLLSVWDPASHAGALPAGLVNLDAGAQYRGRDINLGAQVIEAIERHGQFKYTRYADHDAARQDVRRGLLDFVLEIPADFSQRAMPGEQPGAAKLTIYTSEGNDYAGAGFARRFAPEVAQRVNTMLGETRWELVLSTAAGSQRNLDSLRSALAQLHVAAAELNGGMQRARDGGRDLVEGAQRAEEAAQRLRSSTPALVDGAVQLGGGVRQTGQALRVLEARRPGDSELASLRQGGRGLAEGQRDLGRGLELLAANARKLETGLGQMREAADEIPLFGGRLVEAAGQMEDGTRQLAAGLDRSVEGQARLQQGQMRLDESLAALGEGNARMGAALATISARLPEETRLESFVEGTRELQRGSDALLGGIRQVNSGTQTLHAGLVKLGDGAGRLVTGLELLRQTLPGAVEAPGGSAQGLALSVEPVVEVVAPVANYGTALTPNFVPLALWVGAVMTAFLVSFRRIPEALHGAPGPALALGKLLLPMTVVLLQALLMLAMLVYVLKLPLTQPALFALTLVTASATFLALVFMLVRLLGALGKVLAVLLLIVQVSAAGALLPIQLSDAAFQAMHPYLPLTWVVRAFRASLFGAFDGMFWPAWQAVAGIGVAALLLGALAGRWRPVPPAQWSPPFDFD